MPTEENWANSSAASLEYQARIQRDTPFHQITVTCSSSRPEASMTG